MEEFIQKKHGGYSVFFTDTDNTFEYQSKFGSGCTLSQSGNAAPVIDYHSNFCKLIVGGVFSTGTAVVTTPDSSSYLIKIQRVDPSYTSVHHFYQSRPSNDSSPNEQVVVDPLSQQTSSYSVLGGVIGNTENEYPASNQGIGYSGSGQVDFWETYIGRYMGISGSQVNTYAVSNYLHEMNENEKKRTIKILHPRFKREAVQELESLLRV
jgi:hypothetical protein